MQEFIRSIGSNPAYLVLMVFFAWYPLFTSIMWAVTAVLYSLRRERRSDRDFYDIPDSELPLVTVIVPAHCEGTMIVRTLEGVLALDYPRIQAIVIRETDSRLTVIDKRVNEGKAMALNDAIPLAEGELILVLDADSTPDPDALRWMVPHFVRNARLAAVTGNPRVHNTNRLLGKIQAVEFSSIISLLKRAQVVWGPCTGRAPWRTWGSSSTTAPRKT